VIAGLNTEMMPGLKVNIQRTQDPVTAPQQYPPQYKKPVLKAFSHQIFQDLTGWFSCNGWTAVLFRSINFS
jgi:hypothetical protein